MYTINWLIIIYILISSSLIAKSKQKGRGFYLIGNWCIVIWLIFIAKHASTYQILYAWSPLLLLPILHRNTLMTTSVIHNKTYDSEFINFEERYFPFVMNFHKNNRAKNTILSEYLHACYFSFYLFIYGIPLYFYLTNNLFAFYQSSFAILFVLLSCFITHTLLPVHGPRNIFLKIDDKRSYGYFFKLVHFILVSGSTPGTAFPSGHTALASVVLLMTFHLDLQLFYCILPIATGLILSTIYGRFHYLLDLIFAIIYALIAYQITIYLYA